MKLRLWLMVIALIIVQLAPSGFGQVALVPLPADLNGQLNGVPYRIRVPLNWNGTLLVYAYGYAEAFDPPAQAPMAPADTDAQMLLARGYALAGLEATGAVPLSGAATVAGWNFKERMQETVAMTSAFRDLVGKPKHTIMWGKSMGGLVTIAMIEKFPGLFDGAIALCSPAAGTPRVFDQKIGVTLAYSVAFGWDDQWGTPGDILPSLDFMTDVYPHALARAGISNKLSWEFLRLVNRIPFDGSFYGPINFRFQTLWLAFVPIPDLNLRAGGRVPQNLSTEYTLSDEDRQFLKDEFPDKNPAALMAEVDGWLAQMNGSSRYISDRNARNYAEHYINPTGQITRPVLTLHTTGDAAAIPNNESAYRVVVEQQGKGDLLMQEFTTGITNNGMHVNTHCTFSPPQYFAAIDAMIQWLDTGSRPNPSDYFPEALGFSPDYVPEPWPW
jgi:pimeloyl-ACP methyl ester carboxylesterase